MRVFFLPIPLCFFCFLYLARPTSESLTGRGFSPLFTLLNYMPHSFSLELIPSVFASCFMHNDILSTHKKGGASLLCVSLLSCSFWEELKLNTLFLFCLISHVLLYFIRCYFVSHSPNEISISPEFFIPASSGKASVNTLCPSKSPKIVLRLCFRD